VQDASVNNENEDGGSGHTTPTAEPRAPVSGSSQAQRSIAPLSSTNLAGTTVHDVTVEVVIAPLVHGLNGSLHAPERKSSYANAIQASCIISIWSIEDTQYFTLTFTSATPADPKHLQPSSRVVNRTNTLPQLNKSRSSGSSSSSGKRSGHSNPNSKVVTPTLQQPEFPPRGPPLKSRGDLSSSASIFQKATQLKDAILNSINMPAYGKDCREGQRYEMIVRLT